MSSEENKQSVIYFMDSVFNHGNLNVIDEQTPPDSVDHQEPLGTNFAQHLKAVVIGLRTAFPDLHFEIHDIIAEGDLVAFRSTMTGTHEGVFSLGPISNLPPSGNKVSVAHMHFIRMNNGFTYDLWHVWDIPALMRQLNIQPMPH
jgi:hypothetical protein